MKILIVAWLLAIGYLMIVLNYSSMNFNYWLSGTHFGIIFIWTILEIYRGKIK